MLLAIDVGNTQVVLGLFRNSQLVSTFRLPSESTHTVDQYAIELHGLLALHGFTTRDIHNIVISCVVPTLERVFAKLAQRYFSREALIVKSEMDLGITSTLESPTTVGSDRLVNALAVSKIYGTPAIVVDFGTATTFDVVGQGGTYEGGVIAPGVLISAEALTQRTAQLPSVDVQRPKQVVGKNTVDAMRSGIFWGYLSSVDGILSAIESEIGPVKHIVATGGLGTIFTAESRMIHRYVPDLTLQGLRILAVRHGMHGDGNE